MRLSFLFAFLFIHFSAFPWEPKDYLSFFPEEIAEKAAETGKSDSYSPIEQEVFVLTNLARMAPREFSELVTAYVAKSKFYQSNNSYVQSLKRDLLRAKPILSPLETHGILQELATSHAKYGISSGKYGHQNAPQRAKTVNNKMNHSMYAENCAYHDTNAMDAVMGLLIDEGIKDLGHRKTILNSKLTHMGIAMLPMKKPREFILIQSFSAK